MKKPIFYTFLMSFLLSAFILTSCAAPTRQFVKFANSTELEPTKARIYVIRSGGSGKELSTPIYCNDLLVGKTGGKAYLCWDVSEGSYRVGNTQHINAGITLGAASDEDIFTINAKHGKTYYIKEHPISRGWGRKVFLFDILEKHEGESFLKKKREPKINYAE